MSKERKFQISRTAIALIVALLLGVAVMLPALILGGKDAQAIDASEWATVAQYLDAYIDAQYSATDDGEAGFLLTAAALKTRLDSNNDGTYLGEGDDAANAPVIVDVLNGAFGGIVPKTSVMTSWSTTAGDAATIDEIAAWVAKHESAGFSTDIVNYCLTGHTESVVTGAYGAISQAGGFGSTPPTVVDLKWGRYGWDTGTHPYSSTKNITANIDAAVTSALPTNALLDCSAETTDAGMVRCVASDALSKVGYGIQPWDVADDGLYQPVDLRSSIASTMSDQTTADTAYAQQVPLQNLFDATGTYAELKKIDTAPATVFFTNRTQHTAGIAAVGATMLGYDAVFASWGLPQWNNTIGEKYDPATDAMNYGLDASLTIDTTPPGITAGPLGQNVTKTTADVTWTTDEPATSKIVLGTSSGGPYNVTVPAQDTILHGSHTVSATGLSAGTTYYGKVYTYDGMANETVGSEFSFTTVSITDRYLYLPWYDSIAASGLRSWINISNLEAGTVSGVEVKVGGEVKWTGDIASNGQENLQYADLMGGPAVVRIPNGLTSGDTLVVSERTLYKASFNENLAFDNANASSEYGFPWYDNNAASGMLGDWFAIVNPSDVDTIDVKVFINDMGTPAITRTGIAPGAVDAFQMSTMTVNGPVKVVAYATGDPGTPKDVICSQRVIYWDSFNEVFGLPLV